MASIYHLISLANLLTDSIAVSEKELVFCLRSRFQSESGFTTFKLQVVSHELRVVILRK